MRDAGDLRGDPAVARVDATASATSRVGRKPSPPGPDRIESPVQSLHLRAGRLQIPLRSSVRAGGDAREPSAQRQRQPGNAPEPRRRRFTDFAPVRARARLDKRVGRDKPAVELPDPTDTSTIVGRRGAVVWGAASEPQPQRTDATPRASTPTIHLPTDSLSIPARARGYSCVQDWRGREWRSRSPRLRPLSPPRAAVRAHRSSRSLQRS